ncbi:PREDICTED: transmembrane protease serine 12-like, partial [Thamnophis sirtalis]|uniref:Transmembrane protease serine 12-like n=1 Tax=Thamnophis sirtalis TaxID=35019 RepID=A0A6I9Z7D0_9SAUR
SEPYMTAVSTNRGECTARVKGITSSFSATQRHCPTLFEIDFGQFSEAVSRAKASCDLEDPEMWRAVIGLHHLFKHKTHTIKKRIKEIKIFHYYNSAKYEDDIAVFKLSKPVIFNDYIQPICLPNADLALTSEMKCFISGWGTNKEKGKGTLILQEAQLQIFSLDTCNQFDWHAGSIPDTAFCAGSETGDVDTCQGDSGGPLVCYLSDSKYYIVGITSYGVGCGRPKYPGVYTNLPKYMFWVYYLFFNPQEFVESNLMNVYKTMLEKQLFHVLNYFSSEKYALSFETM